MKNKLHELAILKNEKYYKSFHILHDIKWYLYTYSIQIVIQESLQYSVSILNLTNNQNKDRWVNNTSILPIMKFE